MTGKSAGPDEAQAVAELMLEVARCFFRIRALGQKNGLITAWGGGTFGFLRTLAIEGPLTVPQIAKLRPTSRQRMQRLADELAAEGLVEFIDNPKHRRSRLVRLTKAGEVRYNDMDDRLHKLASSLRVGVGTEEIRRTTKVIRQLMTEVTARSAPVMDARREDDRPQHS